MYDSIGLLLRAACRYWPIPLVLILVAGLAFALYAPPRFAARGSAAHLVLIGVLALSALAFAGPFFRAATHVAEFIGAFSGAPTLPQGPHHVARQDIRFEQNGRAYLFTLWSPIAGADIAHTEPRQCADAMNSAPLSAEGAPLLLYASGWGGARDENATLIRALASQGYIVAAFDDIAHDAPYTSIEDIEAQTAQIDLSTDSSVAETERQANRRLTLSVEKARAILNYMFGCIDADTTWRARTARDSAGFLGFSFGGAIGAELALSEPHIRAIANIDGALYGRAAQQIAPQPYLVLASDFDPISERHLRSSRRLEYQIWNDGVAQEIANAQRADSHMYTLRNATHEAFNDSYAAPYNLRYWPLLSPARARTITYAYVADFFDTHLRAGGGDLLANAPPYYEIETVTDTARRLARNANAPM